MQKINKKKCFLSLPDKCFGAITFFKLFVIGKAGTNQSQQMLLSAPLILQFYVTALTFHKTKHLLNTESYIDIF